MIHRLSAFDTLVETISTEEARAMLANIEESMKTSKTTFLNNAVSLIESDNVQSIRKVADEPFFIRFFLKIRSFFSAVPLEVVHEKRLLFKLGKRLQRNYRQYIDIKKNVFLFEFYEMLHNLRKAQVFFVPLLSAYENDKGSLYLLVSSFIIPNTYEKLVQVTDPFNLDEVDPSDPRVRNNLLKTIDTVFSTITASKKAEIYLCAQAIEWMKHFCNIPIDKILLKFTIRSTTDVFCPIDTIASDLNTLASVLHAEKTMPTTLLRALFLLSKQEQLHGDSLDMGQESTAFVSQASQVLYDIGYIVSEIPVADFARYASQSIHPISRTAYGGEDWFLLFKKAWKKRLNDRWLLWSSHQKKVVINKKVLDLFKVDELKTLQYRPWENLWIPLQFKHEFMLNVLYTFFFSFYSATMHPILEIILMEGNFYRRENLTEYTSVFTVLEKQSACITDFEEQLSPAGKIGKSFKQYKEKGGISLKNKNALETLMKDIELTAKQIISASIAALNTVTAILNGILHGEKKDIYAPLVNWSVIQGDRNEAFRQKVNLLYAHLLKITILLSETKTIEFTA